MQYNPQLLEKDLSEWRTVAMRACEFAKTPEAKERARQSVERYNRVSGNIQAREKEVERLIKRLETELENACQHYANLRKQYDTLIDHGFHQPTDVPLGETRRQIFVEQAKVKPNNELIRELSKTYARETWPELY